MKHLLLSPPLAVFSRDFVQLIQNPLCSDFQFMTVLTVRRSIFRPTVTDTMKSPDIINRQIQDNLVTLVTASPPFIDRLAGLEMDLPYLTSHFVGDKDALIGHQAADGGEPRLPIFLRDLGSGDHGRRGRTTHGSLLLHLVLLPGEDAAEQGTEEENNEK